MTLMIREPKERHLKKSFLCIIEEQEMWPVRTLWTFWKRAKSNVPTYQRTTHYSSPMWTVQTNILPAYVHWL
jgi:hypothetical protein